MIQAVPVAFKVLALTRRVLRGMHEQKIDCEFGLSAPRNGASYKDRPFKIFLKVLSRTGSTSSILESSSVKDIRLLTTSNWSKKKRRD